MATLEDKFMLIIDGHEDIAYNAVTFGRDYARTAKDTRAAEADNTRARAVMGDCTLGLPEWLKGNVGIIFATLFAMPARRKMSGTETGVAAYATPQEAHDQAMGQLDVYYRLADENPRFALVREQKELNTVLAAWEEDVPEEKRQIGLVILMEGADPIIKPQDLERWYERGLRIVGPSWLAGTRYAGGDASGGPLTDEGIQLLRVMMDFNMALDVSHLSEQACLQAIDRYDGPVIASHSNPRRLVSGNRQLSDDMIRRLLERDGVMGIVPVNSMLREGWRRGDRKDAVTAADVASAMDYVCQMAGDARHAALGTDFDGGFGAESIPEELDTIADLPQVATALKARGYAGADIEAMMSGNWLRILRRTLP
jgi:membrane dipeptidase